MSRQGFSLEREQHATLVVGGGAAERLDYARRLAAARLCVGSGEKPCGSCRHCRKAAAEVHPDISYLRPKKQSMLVDEARELRAQAYVLPNEAALSVFIVEDADKMSVKAQNVLLKVLEEPPKHAVFILLAVSAAGLLPTARSRCALVNLGEAEAPPVPDEAKDLLDALCERDSFRLALCCRKLEKMEREQFPELLNGARELLRLALGEKLRRDSGAVQAEKAARSLSKKQITALIGALGALYEYCELNTGTGHLAGLVNAYCWEAIH